MDINLLFPILVGIIAAIITVVAKSYYDVITSSFRIRPRNISGFWKGEAIYQSDRSPSGRAFTCSIKQLGPRVSGTLTSAGEFATEYKIEGHFFESEYVVITITNVNSEMLNYATGILRLNKFGNELRGSFVGRARTTENAVSGTLLLNKG